MARPYKSTIACGALYVLQVLREWKMLLFQSYKNRAELALGNQSGLSAFLLVDGCRNGGVVDRVEALNKRWASTPTMTWPHKGSCGHSVCLMRGNPRAKKLSPPQILRRCRDSVTSDRNSRTCRAIGAHQVSHAVLPRVSPAVIGSAPPPKTW